MSKSILNVFIFRFVRFVESIDGHVSDKEIEAYEKDEI
jgi:hypothetical protein